MAPRLVLTSGERSGSSLPLEQAGVRIGRHADNDLVLPHEIVSRRQATLRYENGRYILCDESSTNGTFVNARRVSEQVLRDGDQIEFGIGGPTARFEHDSPTIEIPSDSAAEGSYELRCPRCSSPVPIRTTEALADSGRISFVRLDAASLPSICPTCEVPLDAGQLEHMLG